MHSKTINISVFFCQLNNSQKAKESRVRAAPLTRVPFCGLFARDVSPGVEDPAAAPLAGHGHGLHGSEQRAGVPWLG